MTEPLSKKQQDRQFVDVYRRYYPFILKLCAARLGGDADLAEDCTQEAFYVLYKKYLAGVTVENPRAFLAKTAHLILLNKRTRRTAEAARRAELDENMPDGDGWLAASEGAMLMETLQEPLNEKERTLFRLRYVEERSVAEIAALTDSTVTAVTTRLSRLRRRLKETMKENGVRE